MTKVVVAGVGETLPFDRDVKITKRKTPSELRGELLKRPSLAGLVEKPSVVDIGSMRWTHNACSEAPRLIDTQMPYPVTKNNVRGRLLSRKQNPKEAGSKGVGIQNNFDVPMTLYSKRRAENLCVDDTIALEGNRSNSNQANNRAKECNNVTFPSLGGSFLVGEKSSGSSDVDMDKVLKGVISYQPESIETSHDMVQTQYSEFLMPGDKIPLDLTLKTNVRLQSSSSVNWFHRLANCSAVNGYAHHPSQGTTYPFGPTSAGQVTRAGTFRSWVHPQSTLPRPVIAALTLAGGQMEFLLKRQQLWEDSFRDLYYMFRKKLCELFYVCTEQFVVLFIGSNALKETSHSCSAYVSQSTRNLRSLLTEHDVSFSMPLCLSKIEEATSEDLVELSEIAKHNLGQTRAVETMSGVDNSPQSLLMFSGNKNVHGLYDFLLNYRSFLPSLTSDDVPLLYSPVPFENAARSLPEIRCKEVKRLDYVSNKDSESSKGPISGMNYTVEIKDAYIPPWIVSDVCNAMRCNGSVFEASFTTKSSTSGLNVGLGITKDKLLEKVTTENPVLGNENSFGILNAAVSHHLHSAHLRGLKYSDSSYTGFLSWVS